MNAGICSVVGEALLYIATLQLGPRNGGWGGSGEVIKLRKTC